MNNLIIGFGEIGKGLYGAMEGKELVTTYDSKYDSYKRIEANFDIIHICIPGNIPNFKEECIRYIEKIKPKVATVIHSTVIPNTCREIALATDSPVFHCPIRGKHPNMAEHIKVYTLHIGCDNYAVGQVLLDCFTRQYDLRAILVSGTTTTELGKILELYRYGLEIYSAYLQSEVCKLYNTNYFDTVEGFIHSYNQGLDKVGMPQFKQPSIPEKQDRFIGGHCVVENCYELMKDLPHEESIRDILREIVYFGKGERKLC